MRFIGVALSSGMEATLPFGAAGLGWWRIGCGQFAAQPRLGAAGRGRSRRHQAQHGVEIVGGLAAIAALQARQPAFEQRLGMIGRDPERPPGIVQRALGIARVAPGGGAQHQDVDVVWPQPQRVVEVGDGARPGQHGGIAQPAIEPQFGIVALELDGAALRLGGALGQARFHEGLAGLGPQLGPQARTLVSHVAGDRFEARRGFAVAAGLEQGERGAMARSQAAALAPPLLGRRQRLQGFAAGQRHAVVVALELIGRAVERPEPLRGAGRRREKRQRRKRMARRQHACKQPRRNDSDKMAKRLFIFGLGYSGLEIARLARAAGWTVAGTCTSDEKADHLRRDGIEAWRFDGTTAPPAQALENVSHVLSTIAPGPAGAMGDPVLRASSGLLGEVRWLGYLSTTGVYGNHDGGWVDEDTPAKPGQPRSIERLATERAWQALGLQAGAVVDIFRLPGIYGPGRSAIDQVKAGTARRIDKPGQVFSRIHVEDIAGTVLLAISQAHNGAVYNVADDLPASTSEVVAFACELLGRPVPPAIPWEEAAPAMSDMARSFYAENRRVRNDRIKKELGVVLRYPTYREGLRAVLARS